MTTVNTIEQKILQMDGGEFQKLCDAYLSMIGYGRPNSFGAVAGSNKVKKGTPDTFFERPNGKLVFAEATNQKDGIFKKLSGDLANCLNEKKTKVPTTKVEEIVFCYTSQLAPNEVISLKKKCEKKNIKLTLLGISALANDLLNYSILLRHFLNLNIDTGQIIPLEAFPSIYGKSKFATTLETKFHFREKEMEDFLTKVKNNNLIIISGKSGVGKSRFALEGCRAFITQHPEYKAFSIVSLSHNLYNDLIEKFSLPGQYIILVDDANRVINFSYFMDILRNRKSNQDIKVVVTVRDYALDKIENEALNYPHSSIQLENLADKQIREFAKDEFGILNQFYLERIEDLSKGNPRIAVMVSRLAVEKNTLESINDISALYDEYFASIKLDIQDFGENNLLRTAGIISFLRIIDKSNEQLMSGIERSFNIPTDVFWDCISKLNELEMVDMYEEGEIVRVSDQILSTYLFYMAFFKEKVLDFSLVLQNYFPDYLSKINDSLNPAISAFNQNKIFEIMRPKVQNLWDELATNGDEDKLTILVQSFWYLDQSKTLSFLRKRLSNSQFANFDLMQLEQLDDNKINNVHVNAELQLLGRLRYGFPEIQPIALETLIDYVKIRPADMLQVLHILIVDYGFDRYSDYNATLTQERVINLLWAKTENGENEIYSRLFIATARHYIKIHFQSHESKSNTVTFYEFAIPPTKNVLELRKKIFNFLIVLYSKYPEYILELFTHYINAYHQGASPKIFSSDSKILIEFIKNYLQPENYIHCIFVNDYLDFLADHKVPHTKKLRKQFQNNKYLVYQILSENRRDFRQYEYQEYLKLREEKLKLFFLSITEDDLLKFIEQSVDISSDFRLQSDGHEIISGFKTAMGVLATERKDLLEVALFHCLQKGNPLELPPVSFVTLHKRNYGKSKALDFFSSIDHPNKIRWLFGFYESLAQEEIEAKDVIMLNQLFEKADQTQFPGYLDFLLDYTNLDIRIVAKAAQCILDKCEVQHSSWILNTITNPYMEFHKQLEKLFREDVETLKKVYLTVKSAKGNDDHNSLTLSKILDLDLDFINEYIEWIYTPAGEKKRWFHEEQDYTALWSRKDYKEVFKRVVELVYEKEGLSHYYTELQPFFVHHKPQNMTSDIEQRQEELFSDFIQERCNDINFIEYLFEVIAFFSQERRYRLIALFLKCNNILGDFQRLAIEPRSMTLVSGSFVPVYQRQIDYLKSLLPLMNNSDLLEHQVYLRQMIDRWEQRIKSEKKRDFMGTDF